MTTLEEVVAVLLGVAALGIGLLAFLFTSQATLGPTIMGFACLLGILSRLAQAEAHHPGR